ncbi:acetoacetate metabolism regulatory protein AtoC [Desulfocucumis palustris]|uniref:Acetoacetate metabolism regulatory protein AtoC n=1 Tax=Desulfocucumis palustris TaxID=1898651 RepID=A0A2L2X9V3_9FIRM|nr:sigma 54-interacting transcriptional regulator [Desulfocucumis palustris]GBF32928.1 acetoacetate metabolism regulatory protein AtoC [Desulfocucumis palustris]
MQKIEEIFAIIAENEYEGIIYIDAGGIVRWINQGYAGFLELDKENVIGKRIDRLIPHSKLLDVMKSGKPQFGELWEIKGQHVLVHRWPIYKDGKVIGCLGKSLFKDELPLTRDFIKKIKKLENELSYYKEELHRERRAKYSIEEITGSSEKINKLKDKVAKIAKTTSTVLITGESGTGKELFAHAIHNASPRKNMPFVRVNCTSIPEELLESELFGYEEGAFTGAKKGGKPGKFEIAQGGTIFLDEIGDMNRSMQAKLLRVLQEKEIERIGGIESVNVDVRVIAATNRNLEEMTRSNLFREDLYYRLNVVLLNIPPLRERREDIPALTENLINKLAFRLGTGVKSVSGEVLELFNRYDWPGNVRELENILEQAINLTDAAQLKPEDFPVLLKRVSTPKRTVQTITGYNEAMEEAERNILLQALAQTGNNKKEAARLLKIHRSVLYRKLSKLDII